jgi:hypothetical protein
LLIADPFCLCGDGNLVQIGHRKGGKVTVAIAASYGLGQVFKGTEYSQLAFVNVIAFIVIIAILYGPCPAPKSK